MSQERFLWTLGPVLAIFFFGPGAVSLTGPSEQSLIRWFRSMVGNRDLVCAPAVGCVFNELYHHDTLQIRVVHCQMKFDMCLWLLLTLLADTAHFVDAAKLRNAANIAIPTCCCSLAGCLFFLADVLIKILCNLLGCCSAETVTVIGLPVSRPWN